VRREAKPKTVVFYDGKLARLLDFDFLASERLDQIDEALIERFVFERRKQVSPGTVNREKRRCDASCDSHRSGR
jgi:hypothetical protein